jgi:DNA repair protein RadA/Sms
MAKAAARERTAYRCSECGLAAAKWVGRCPECQTWGSVLPTGPAIRTVAGPVSSAALPIGEVNAAAAAAEETGVGELDRVLGGGLVGGAVVLLAGEPGVGKSTLLLAAAAQCAAAGRRVLVVTGEESAAQVKIRAERVGAITPELFLAAETDLAAVLAHVETVSPSLLVIDSVQSMASVEVEGSAGGVAQVREVAAALIRVAKERGLATILVGHVTKDGGIAGPRVLEHLVDVVLHFEGDRGSRFRLLRAVKNRYGPADEVGCFDLDSDGIVGLADPSGLFLSRHGEPVAGTCVTVTVEGRRSLVAEVQALVAGSPLATPRRATSGLDSARLAMLLAVLERRAGIALARSDVYAATVGGVRLSEPGVDLAVAVAIASSASNRICPPGLVCVGEVGLAGEIRPVPGVERRLAEAARLGFSVALVPAGCLTRPAALDVLEVPDIRAALGVLQRPAPAAVPAALSVVPDVLAASGRGAASGP